MTDTERLDWFEKHGASIYKYGCGTPWSVEYWGDGYRGHDRYHGVMSKTLREAIDDAMGRAALAPADTKGEGL